MMDRKVVSRADFPCAGISPKVAGGVFWTLHQFDADLNLTPVVVAPEGDGSAHTGYYLDELVALVRDTDRRTDLQLRPRVGPVRMRQLVRMVFALEERQIVAQVLEAGRWPTCFTCGTKMRPSGGLFLCGSCGSTTSPDPFPGVGVAG